MEHRAGRTPAQQEESMPTDEELVASDYERMMAEAKVAFANSPNPSIMEVARVLAEQIALNPYTRLSWEDFRELNRPREPDAGQ